MELRNELLPYQTTGVEKLKKIKVGALFMEQGTGKTITALELYRIRKDAGKVEKLLWLCPCSAKNNIKEEMVKQAPWEMLSDVIICGIESLSSSTRANVYLRNLVKSNKCFLIVDESLLVKNPKAYRTTNIMSLASECTYKLILNGTPISRNEADLYAQFYILDWRILGYRSYWSFAANHLEYDQMNPNKVIRCLNTDYLARKIEPYVYQVKKVDCLTLPPKQYSYYYITLTEAQFEHYQEIADSLLYDLNEMRPETIYRLFSGMQAVACGRKVLFRKDTFGKEHLYSVPFFEKSEENPRITELKSHLDGQTKSIIFCTYQEDIHTICEILNNLYGAGSALPFDGSISMKKRMQNLELFKGSTTYLVANRNCAGYSLNLQFCHRIIYYSNGWDLATRLQSEDRIHRIGQSKEVEIIDIVADFTIEERIRKCLARKESLLHLFKDEISRGKKTEELREWLNTASFGGKVRRKVSIYDCSDLEEDNV